MGILTNYVFSVLPRPKKLEFPKNIENCKIAPQKQILCLEIEPNLSKDRSMYKGDYHPF
jgi:hypothetical protein